MYCFKIIKENKLLSRHLPYPFPALTAVLLPNKSRHKFTLHTRCVPSTEQSRLDTLEYMVGSHPLGTYSGERKGVTSGQLENQLSSIL